MIEIKLIPHDGGPCPVRVWSYYVLKFRDGKIKITNDPTWLCWNHYGRDDDIISYCHIEIKEG